MKFLKFQQFGRFFTNVESRGSEVDNVCIYVKAKLFILLILWAFVVIIYIILLRTSVSRIQISQRNLKLQGKVWSNYDRSIGDSCSGKGLSSRSFWGFSPDPTWRAYSSPWIPPAVLRPHLLVPPLFQNPVSAPDLSNMYLHKVIYIYIYIYIYKIYIYKVKTLKKT